MNKRKMASIPPCIALAAVLVTAIALVSSAPAFAVVLYPFFGLLLSPIIAGAAMSLNSVSVISNVLRLRSTKL